MVKLQIAACDKCGAREEKVRITAWSSRRGSTRYTGDLCDKCWDNLVRTFNPSTLSKSRHQIVVTEVTEIPKGKD